MNSLHRLILITLAALLPFVIATSQLESESHLDPLERKCPQGEYPGFEVNTFQFDVPAVKFYDAVGSFFHSEWYVSDISVILTFALWVDFLRIRQTGPLTSTRGKDNTVGATRNGTFSGNAYSERLVEYSRSPSKLVMRFTQHSDPDVFNTAPNNLGDAFLLGPYTEELGVYSICGGTATYLSLTSVYCTDKIVLMYDVYQSQRRSAIGGVATTLRARVFDGTCPI
ncbi:hypothetical protein Hypma_001889 [Hypsizygus marmoreus]|uniref:Uncharacterized protein n=1 Tax=Hypsizygus marmoreus TaxID=39966 RepID=A0A369J6W0_HYPMA|nr:hypothetical protein Hypma_001889 [Hypsizygus marmoreus]